MHHVTALWCACAAGRRTTRDSTDETRHSRNAPTDERLSNTTGVHLPSFTNIAVTFVPKIIFRVSSYPIQPQCHKALQSCLRVGPLNGAFVIRLVFVHLIQPNLLLTRIDFLVSQGCSSRSECLCRVVDGSD